MSSREDECVEVNKVKSIEAMEIDLAMQRSLERDADEDFEVSRF